MLTVKQCTITSPLRHTVLNTLHNPSLIRNQHSLASGLTRLPAQLSQSMKWVLSKCQIMILHLLTHLALEISIITHFNAVCAKI
jgi:hypothetical protein